jgi:HK97 gp10 family phage protein
MATEIMVEGADELARALAQIGAEVRRTALSQALGPGARAVLASAQAKVPRQSGKLAASLAIEPGGSDSEHADIYIGSIAKMTPGHGKSPGRRASGGRHTKDDAFYRMHVELGTVHAPPHPYLRPALDETKDRIVARVTQWLRGVVNLPGAWTG